MQKNSNDENWYELLVNSTTGGLGLYEVVGNKVLALYFNDALAALAGMTKEQYTEATKEDGMALVYLPDRIEFEEEIRRSIELEKDIDFTYRVVDKEGRFTWNRVNGKLLKREEGRILFAAVFFDVNDLKERELHLLTQQEKVNLALENSDIYVWEYDIKNSIMIQQAKAVVEYQVPFIIENAPESIVEMGLVHEDSIDDYIGLHQKMKAGEKLVSADIHYIHGNGESVWEKVQYVAICDENNNPIRAVGSAVNLTSFKLLEERYEKELAYQKALKKDNLLVSIRANITQNIIEDIEIAENNLIKKYFTRKFDEAIDYVSRNIVEPEIKKQFRRTFALLNLSELFLEGQRELSIDYQRKIKNGKTLWVSTTAKLLKNPKSNDILCFMYTHNIEEIQIAKEVVQNVVRLDYDYVACIDGKQGKNFLFVNEKTDMLPLLRDVSYEKAMTVNIKKYVVKEEQEEVLKAMSLKNIFLQLEKENTYTQIVTMRKENGEEVNKIWTFSYMNKQNKQIILTRRDITEIVKKDQLQNEELRNALAAAKQASYAKSDFLSRMSHEIRTPMNAIIGMTALAEQSLDNTNQISDYLSKIDVSAHFLLNLINDILDMSRIESGKVVIRQQKFQFEEFISGIHGICAAHASEKGILYKEEIIGFAEDYYIGDSMKLQQVLINIIANAIKFTPFGGCVQFVTSRQKISDEEVKFKFVIKDTGIGIKEKFIPHLFDPFEQESTGTTNPYGGTGLGLAICKNLISLMNGTITVNSIAGLGTEFVIELSLAIAKDDAFETVCCHDEEHIAAVKEKYDFTGKRILLAEDHILNVEVAKKLLQNKGAKIEVAENGLLAIEKFAKAGKGHYQVILMDIRMPVMDGITAAKAIRHMKHSDAKSIPIIAMTANAFEDDVEKTKEAGMNAHLAKPIEPELLYRTLAKYM